MCDITIGDITAGDITSVGLNVCARELLTLVKSVYVYMHKALCGTLGLCRGFIRRCTSNRAVLCIAALCLYIDTRGAAQCYVLLHCVCI